MYHKARAIEKEAESKTAPIIRSECKRLGVRRIPPIEWLDSIKVKGRSITGTYNHIGQKITLNSGMTEERLRKKMPETEIVYRIVRTIFHELKHYIDHRSRGMSMKEYQRDPDKYEAEAMEYAQKMTRQVAAAEGLV